MRLVKPLCRDWSPSAPASCGCVEVRRWAFFLGHHHRSWLLLLAPPKHPYLQTFWPGSCNQRTRVTVYTGWGLGTELPGLCSVPPAAGKLFSHTGTRSPHAPQEDRNPKRQFLTVWLCLQIPPKCSPPAAPDLTYGYKCCLDGLSDFRGTKYIFRCKTSPENISKKSLWGIQHRPAAVSTISSTFCHGTSGKHKAPSASACHG